MKIHASLIIGLAAFALTAGCGAPQCQSNNDCHNGDSCQANMCMPAGQQMLTPPGNTPPGNVVPDMGGGGNNAGTLNCSSAEELVITCWEFQPPLATVSFPGPSPTWTQLTNLRPDPNNPKCVKYCAPKVGGFACIDKHTNEIGNRPGQTVDDSKIGWCGNNAGCKPSYHIVGGRQQTARDYLGKCGWPVQVVDGWNVPVGTL